MQSDINFRIASIYHHLFEAEKDIKGFRVYAFLDADEWQLILKGVILCWWHCVYILYVKRHKHFKINSFITCACINDSVYTKAYFYICIKWHYFLSHTKFLKKRIYFLKWLCVNIKRWSATMAVKAQVGHNEWLNYKLKNENVVTNKYNWHHLILIKGIRETIRYTILQMISWTDA